MSMWTWASDSASGNVRTNATRSVSIADGGDGDERGRAPGHGRAEHRRSPSRRGRSTVRSLAAARVRGVLFLSDSTPCAPRQRCRRPTTPRRPPGARIAESRAVCRGPRLAHDEGMASLNRAIVLLPAAFLLALPATAMAADEPGSSAEPPATPPPPASGVARVGRAPGRLRGRLRRNGVRSGRSRPLDRCNEHVSFWPVRAWRGIAARRSGRAGGGVHHRARGWRCGAVWLEWWQRHAARGPLGESASTPSRRTRGRSSTARPRRRSGCTECDSERATGSPSRTGAPRWAASACGSRSSGMDGPTSRIRSAGSSTASNRARWSAGGAASDYFSAASSTSGALRRRLRRSHLPGKSDSLTPPAQSSQTSSHTTVSGAHVEMQHVWPLPAGAYGPNAAQSDWHWSVAADSVAPASGRSAGVTPSPHVGKSAGSDSTAIESHVHDGPIESQWLAAIASAAIAIHRLCARLPMPHFYDAPTGSSNAGVACSFRDHSGRAAALSLARCCCPHDPRAPSSPTTLRCAPRSGLELGARVSYGAPRRKARRSVRRVGAEDERPVRAVVGARCRGGLPARGGGLPGGRGDLGADGGAQRDDERRIGDGASLRRSLLPRARKPQWHLARVRHGVGSRDGRRRRWTRELPRSRGGPTSNSDTTFAAAPSRSRRTSASRSSSS